MATEKQTVANRQNAKKSTGPRTQEGRLRSRQNSFRHGLTAQTVISILENADEYAELETLIIADYEPQTTIERLLVERLASLLWRLRRSVTIESGLFELLGKAIRDRRSRDQQKARTDQLTVFRNLLNQTVSVNQAKLESRKQGAQNPTIEAARECRPNQRPAPRLRYKPQLPSSRQHRQRSSRAARTLRSQPMAPGCANNGGFEFTSGRTEVLWPNQFSKIPDRL